MFEEIDIQAEAKVVEALYEDRDRLLHLDLFPSEKTRESQKAYDSALAREFQSMSAKDLRRVLDQVQKDKPCYQMELKGEDKGKPDEVDFFLCGFPQGKTLNAKIKLASNYEMADLNARAQVARTLYVGRLAAQESCFFEDGKKALHERQAFEHALARQVKGIDVEKTMALLSKVREQKPGFDFVIQYDKKGLPEAIQLYEECLFQGKVKQASVFLGEKSK